MDLDWYALRAWRRYAALTFALALLLIPAARDWVAEVVFDRGMRIAQHRVERLQPLLADLLTPASPALSS